MKIGIDISQMAYEGTGVARYTKNLVEGLLKIDKENEYVLFFSSLRKPLNKKFISQVINSRVTVKQLKIPPLLLEFLWNRLHLLPVEWLIGKVDVFLSSDWLQPPTKAKKVTTLHDLIIFKYPASFGKRGGHDIVANQKRRLKWVKKECDLVICDSKSTLVDAQKILGIAKDKLKVIYPGGLC